MDNLVERFKARSAQKIGHRGDLNLADHAKLNESSARILIAYDQLIGTPELRDVEMFTLREFEGKAVPVVETLRLHEKEGAVEVVISQLAPKRPLKDASAMARITPLTYIDKSSDVWEVREAHDGQKHLVRRESEDINAIVEARKQRMHFKSASVSFGKLKTAGRAHLANGDQVRFYADGLVYHGQVTSVSKEKVGVSANGRSYSVPMEAVLDVTEMGPTSRAEMEKNVKDYFGEVFLSDQGMAKDISDTEPDHKVAVTSSVSTPTSPIGKPISAAPVNKKEDIRQALFGKRK